jgi:GNAT superfamily N-acetyltransferase
MDKRAADLKATAYAGSADLPALIGFAGEAVRTRLPLEAAWHPGNIVWNLKEAFDGPHAMRLWRRGGEVVAVGWLEAPGELYLETVAGHEDLVGEVLDWAEAATRADPSVPAELAASVTLGDVARIAALEALGFRRGRPEGVRFRKDLADLLPDAPPPDGARVVDCVDIDAEVRAKGHRDAWNHLAHIGIPNARSGFTAEVYRVLRAAPVYDPSLDILIQAATGELVSNCICWADEASGMGLFEPVGTHVDFRGRGFGRAVVLEGLRRLRARGLAWARVGTAHFNAPAIATYTSCGFDLIDRTWWWTKSLEA